MKTIKELRTVLKFHPQEINSSIKFFAENCDIDFDVYLPTKKMNLQRDYVWSVLMNRHIPRMAMLNITNDSKDTRGTYQVIDGKQRLSAMIDFYKGKFDLIIDDKSYFFDKLPEDYQRVIAGYMFPYYIVNEDFGNTFSDDDKISWFRYINFAGTPMDSAHINNLK